MKTKTPSEISIKNMDGENIVLFMSFGMLNRLIAKLGGNPDMTPLIATDYETQERLLKEVFTKREGGRVVSEPDDLDSLKLDIDEAGKLLGWIQEHIDDFFVQMTEKTIKQAEGKLKAVGAAKDLESRFASTKNGSESSPSTKQ